MPFKKILPLIIFFGFLALFSVSVFSNQADPNYQWMLYNLRLPRFILSFSVGAILSLCGLYYQSIFQNPLASPYTLGTSMVSSFAAVLLFSLGLQGQSNIVWAVFLGGSLGYFFLMLFSQFMSSNRRDGLLLAGIAQSLLFSSLVLFVQIYSSPYINQRVIHWMVGSLSVVGWIEPLCAFGALIFIIFFTVFRWSRVEVLSLGDDFSTTRGVNPDRERNLIIALVSFIIALVVAIVGPIGFVGLVVPNFVRLIFSKRMPQWPYLAIIFGGIFFLSCDFLVRLLFPDREIPIGIITSLIGAPLFIAILRKK